MTDHRAATVRLFREQQHAQQVFVLTAVTPFKVSQDRAILVRHANDAQLVTCSGCTPRTALGQGSVRDVAPDELTAFLRGMSQTAAAWTGDAVPSNVHDGVTITVERADSDRYDRVRIVEPAPDSPHARLIAVWTDTFPEVRRLLR